MDSGGLDLGQGEVAVDPDELASFNPVANGNVTVLFAKSGQSVSASTFRTDGNVSNSINTSDVSIVKSKPGTALP